MQLERGKTSTGLLGSFRTIIREEGFVSVVAPHGKLNEAFTFIDLVVFTAVGEDLFHSGSFDQTGVQKALSLHYFSKHPSALQNCAFPSPSCAAT
jgi:hypothetical protein